ncbi:phage portal protein family protein [Pseudomonas lactis]|uniref:phage portal protein family protein n=1 Tax=Pseudomonas lactis TaxID=1615674 RepID=UPI0030B94759
MWVSPTEFVRFAEPKRDKGLTDHIASRGRSFDAQALGMYLPNPDPILKAQGKDIKVYRDLRSSALVGGNIRRRKASVLALERGLKRGDAPVKVERFVREWLADIDMDRVIRELLDASLFGYQPVEIMWRPVGMFVLPEDLLGKPAEWFLYDQDNNLRFRARDAGMTGELCDPQRFVVARQDATYINPYGFADLSMCFWPAVFMKGGLKFWVQFTEKYGSPWVIGKHSRGATDGETDLLLDSLESMVQDAVAVIPDDASVQIIEATGKTGSAEVYRGLLEYCRSEINVAMLGQNQTTEKESNRASAQAGAEVTKDIRDGDAGIVAAALNAVIRRIVDINFGESVKAPVYELWEQEEIDKLLAERDKSLSDSGVQFTSQYWKRKYNLVDGDIVEAAPPATAPEFAEAALKPILDQVALDQAIDDLPAQLLQEQSEQAVAPLIEALQRGRSDSEALGLLAEVYPQMDTQALEQTLARLMFISDIWGRLSANADRED